MRRVLIAGAGLGGFRSARSLRDRGFDGDIVVVGDEDRLPYDRPPLSKQLLAGETSPEHCRLAGSTSDMGWHLGAAIVSASLRRREVELAGGTMMDFDDLVIATGRRARPWPGRLPQSGVHTLRSLSDVAAFQEDLVNADSVVIIGAGFVGCETAATLRKRGFDVTVVDVVGHPMPALGAIAGETARRLHEEHGVTWRLGSAVGRIEGDTHVTGVRLKDGELLAADTVLVSIGSLPNTEWLQGTEIALRDGAVQVDNTGQVVDQTGAPVPGVWAVGDAAAWPHQHAGGPACIEHWSNARDMADQVAANLVASSPPAALTAVPSFWSDQYDVKIKSVGYLPGADQFALVDADPVRHALVVEALREGEIIGAITFNRPKAVLRYQRTLRDAATTAPSSPECA